MTIKVVNGAEETLFEFNSNILPKKNDYINYGNTHRYGIKKVICEFSVHKNGSTEPITYLVFVK